MRYRIGILSTGGSTTGIPVPDDVLGELGPARRPPVRVSVGGHTFRTTIGIMGGLAMIPLSAENRAAAGVAGGDQVDVDVELDTEPRTVEVPEDLAAALASTPMARDAFDALSPSRRKAHVLAVESARTPETRQRRVTKVLSELQP